MKRQHSKDAPPKDISSKDISPRDKSPKDNPPRTHPPRTHPRAIPRSVKPNQAHRRASTRPRSHPICSFCQLARMS